MKRLYLTSSVHAVAHDIAAKENLSDKNKLVFIYTSAEPDINEGEDVTWMHNDRNALVDAGFVVTDYTITGKTLDDLKKDLINFDYIYVSGGYASYLLKQAHTSGFFNYVKVLVNEKSKTYIGTSAGSIICGPKCPDYLLEATDERNTEKQKGFELVTFTMVPHWGSEYFKDLYLKGRLEIAYRADQVPLLILTDNQYVHVEGDKYEIIDVKAT